MSIDPPNRYIATDIVIEYEDGIVLIDRLYPPYGTGMPGGMLELHLTAAENAVKEAREETGLDIELLHHPDQPIAVMTDPQRDPRGPVMTMLYVARGRGTLRAGDDAKAARKYTRPEVERLIEEDRLIIDHGRMLKMYFAWRDAQ